MARRSPRCAGDRGDSLIEILMAITIMGIAFTAILTGFGTSIKASGLHQDMADSQAAVRNAAEQLKSNTYVPCAGVGATANYTASVPSGFHLDIAAPQIWDNTAATFVTATAVNCVTAQLQSISIGVCRTSQVVSGSCPANLAQTLVVTKRST
jgi:prepilin-type N-terminal cleavage/methylation domain-containing protein